ncbi:MAG: CGNR zinc finger domain-containing protein [bacterium]
MSLGRRRTFVGVDRLPLVGGSLCLDLANTTGARDTVEPRERLARYDDLLLWSRRTGIVDANRAKQLRAASARRPGDSLRALSRVRALREEIHHIFRAIANGNDPDATLVGGLGRRWRTARQQQQLVASDHGRFELRFVVRADDLDQLQWPIMESAIDLLTSERLSLVHQCAECDWLFLDDSKNGSRRWCKNTCGNRARARAQYARRTNRAE